VYYRRDHRWCLRNYCRYNGEKIAGRERGGGIDMSSYMLWQIGMICVAAAYALTALFFTANNKKGGKK
jgi:hypothetical protein